MRDSYDGLITQTWCFLTFLCAEQMIFRHSVLYILTVLIDIAQLLATESTEEVRRTIAFNTYV
jgi:hypothetical protein